MTAPVSLLPPMAGGTFPGPVIEGLSDQEQALITGLSNKLAMQSTYINTRWAYYDGLQRLQLLGISIPPQLAGVRTVVDWPRICVDPLVQRAEFAGFRLPKATEIDDELAEHWDANDMAGELPLAFLDSLVARCGYLLFGSPDTPGDSPIITVESPLNVAVKWDARTRALEALYQAYEVEGTYRAALMLPNRNIYASRDQYGQGWTVESVDDHNLGEVTAVRLVNRGRSSDREGRSQITPAIMNTTDSAVRALLGMEIAREVYSIPHLYILGASESDFVAPDGVTRKTALDMAMTKILALERDEEGNLPTIGQLKAFDPAVFTKIIDSHGKLMASFTGFPPAYFGVTTTANPASADAIRVGQDGLDRAGRQVQLQATPGLRKAGQLLWRFANNGAELPADLKRLEVDWVDPATPTPAATTDAMVKQIAAGTVPPRSDVTLSRLGYSAVERARLEQDYQTDPGAQILDQLASSLAAKLARYDVAITKDLAPDTPAQGSAVPAEK